MRRNFGNHNNSNNSSNFSRSDRRDDRNDRYQTGNDYRKPMNRSFDRNASSDYKRPRRDHLDDSRHSYQQDRRSVRDFHQHREGGNRSDRFNDRSSGSNYRREDHSRDRSFNRHHSPPAMRSRDDSRGFRERDNSSSRRRMSPPPPRRESKPSIKSRLNPPLRSSIRAVGSALARSRLARATGSSRILRRNDLRSGLIAKRTAPVNRAKDYAKKIRQARLKLSERSGSARKSQSRGRSTSSKMNSEDKSPKKETDGGEASRKQENDNEEVDYLAIANDVNFDEDENESTTGGKVKSATEDKEKLPKELSEADKKPKEEASKDDSKPSRNRSPSKEFDYKCVHCDMHLSSGQDYRNHLTRRTHLLAMRGVALKIRMTLNHLRKVQRDRQLEIEARIKDVEKITSKYCIICKLNFRQSKEEHRESDDHKKIRNFLKPNCKICNLQMTSPMKYEMHRCQLEHMRRKQRKQDGTDDEIDLQELDIGDFKTVDSVGDVDDEKNEDKDEIGMDTEMESDETTKVLGKEYIAKVEVNYCSLCREYLSRRNDDDKVIADHCKSTMHQKYYNQRKKDNEKKSKTSGKEADGKLSKSPSSTSKLHNGGEEDKKHDETNAVSIVKEEPKEESSKFNRYDEKNDE